MTQGLSDAKLQEYDRNGFVLVERLLSQDIIEGLRQEIDGLTRQAISARQNKDHSFPISSFEFEKDDPSILRRIQEPNQMSKVFADLCSNPLVISTLQSVLGHSVRLQRMKLNVKSPGIGALVDWHQDFAFYPHTNNSVTALGILIDDVDEENAPLMAFPGTHKQPVLDHHHNGFFCGSINMEKCGLDPAKGTKLTGPAGSVTLHHGHTVHGSAVNRSDKSRRMLFLECAAGDAWPLMSDEIGKDGPIMLSGELSWTPRMEGIDVRLPAPTPELEHDSIYDIQQLRA
ncbi:MAG: phytanoyl-CoA dioxygenase family protein [Pseudomonadota bacterium]